SVAGFGSRPGASLRTRRPFDRVTPMAEGPRPSLVLVPKHRPAPSRGGPGGPARRKRQRRESGQALSEMLFRDALAGERRRADRFEECFVVLLISLSARTFQAARWTPVVEALSAAKQDTDVMGWFEQDNVLGLIRPLAGGSATKAAADLAPTVQAELE